MDGPRLRLSNRFFPPRYSTGSRVTRYSTSPTNESGILNRGIVRVSNFRLNPVDGARGREREREKRDSPLFFADLPSRTFTIKASLAWRSLGKHGSNAVGSHAPHTSTVLMQIQPALRITRCNVTVGEQTSWARLEF